MVRLPDHSLNVNNDNNLITVPLPLLLKGLLLVEPQSHLNLLQENYQCQFQTAEKYTVNLGQETLW